MSDIGIDQVPVPGGGTGVNQPDKPYGEGVELDTLRSSFPSTPQGGAPGQAPPGPSKPLPQFAPPPPGGAPVPGVPTPLLAPGTGSPISSSPIAQQAPRLSVEQNRLRQLDRLANDPGVSDETREWAQALLKAILS